MADEPTTQETVSEQDLASDKLPRMFPLRQGFFSFMFIAFFSLSVLVLNVTKTLGLFGESDIYQLVLDWLRWPIQDVTILRDVYDFIVTFPGDEFIGIEALYISGGYVLTFFTVSLLTMRRGVSRILFTGRASKRFLLQLFLFFGLFIVFVQVLKIVVLVLIGYGTYLGDGGVAIYMLIAGATTWVFFQALALFTAARRSGTRAEGRLTKRKGKGAYGFALFAPYLVLMVIGGIYIAYKIFLDVVVEDILGVTDTSLWRSFINYFTIAMAVFCILPSLAAFASKKRHQKSFDNLVVMMTILSMYPYILFNFTIYFLLPALGGVGGGGGGDTLISRIFLLVDLIFTLVLLVMALRSVGKRTNYKFGALDKHAFILFIYAALAGQFGIRYLQTRGLPSAFADVSLWLLNGQYVLVNLFVVVALFFSVLLFSSKKFGLYFRVHETVSKADNIRLDFIRNYLRDEYVRREEPYLLDTIYESLSTVMKLERFEVMQLVEKAKRKHPDLRIDGMKKRYVYFETDG